ncbi:MULTISPECIES: nitrate reductase cytochrome c-type subunit [Aeromonas]|uniref:Periplasmic nitrate reductase, electron transfer subunit n=1 Tax=Aeromonas hydrophila subsp. hydrophila (strain ATCC 7966 / DSM 30187 / BCRC 13018 / CCUG 14551 / JCM 1027 / KCTC 2358 / NCIMB 9240 / NCTC 8049) TaxID=380703 RepID=A0KIM4_AERHH|nr:MULTISPECIES: nitrate reductase cytochrome c-type subunit [Aeromonas]ABK36619.1 periplasmiC nitrate reductase, diheme cytochrome c subunit [Aeromonas hydrophila subsp. hydrophila ATCC 7966]AGM43536.1 periplasmic nitrate reductase, diheme cytochrome c subunit [Aeromonas hydrophila ML09-119]AHX32225.1 nitrate reductase [Aeromonas hydrophila subsp. hydrophila AL09-71]AHX69023.1 nitrate reductase [Aeromonas hydrophila pc104A]AJE36981.1 nitrate reductase [Aeromonas hydrophila J-1]
MKKLIGAMLACLMAGSLMAAVPEITNSTGGIKSERGNTDLVTDADAAPMKNFRKDGDLYDRQYMHQPPLIPHDTRNYEVDNKVNKCLACHSFKNASAMKAPKISPTHFETRDGMTLGEVSPRRYFCLQCHVPQADAKPLVENTFKPVEALN